MSAVPVRSPQGDAAFFDALARGHSVGAACRAAGYARSSVYRWRSADSAFAAAWHQAQETEVAALEAEADRRLRERYEEPIHANGVLIGYRNICPDPLLYARFQA